MLPGVLGNNNLINRYRSGERHQHPENEHSQSPCHLIRTAHTPDWHTATKVRRSAVRLSNHPPCAFPLQEFKRTVPRRVPGGCASVGGKSAKLVDLRRVSVNGTPGTSLLRSREPSTRRSGSVSNNYRWLIR